MVKSTTNHKLQVISRAGFSTLPTMLFLGGLIVEIAIAMTFLFQIFSTTHFAARLSGQAFVIAGAGIDDALIRIVRNKNCPGTGCPSSYDLEVNPGTASITICKDSCDEVGKTRIESIGSTGVQRRKIRAILSVDAVTGKIDIDSIQETSL
jgi:hypothetical protein